MLRRVSLNTSEPITVSSLELSSTFTPRIGITSSQGGDTTTDASGTSESEGDSSDSEEHEIEMFTISPHLQRLLGGEARSISSLSKEEAANIGGKLHSVCLFLNDGFAKLISTITQHLRGCSADPIEYATTLKLLQDLCFVSGELPSSYMLKDVSFDRGNVIGKGGEATIYSGFMNNQSVVVREVVMPRNFWPLPAGRQIIKVIV